MFFVPVFAWLLAAQAVLLPLAKAHAAQTMGTSGALAVFCSSVLPVQGDEPQDSAAKQVHDFGCCTLASRLDLSTPVAVPSAPEPLVLVERVATRLHHAQAQSRAPPEITATPLAARAPPALG